MATVIRTELQHIRTIRLLVNMIARTIEDTTRQGVEWVMIPMGSLIHTDTYRHLLTIKKERTRQQQIIVSRSNHIHKEMFLEASRTFSMTQINLLIKASRSRNISEERLV